jgi:hypothetical protein
MRFAMPMKREDRALLLRWVVALTLVPGLFFAGLAWGYRNAPPELAGVPTPQWVVNLYIGISFLLGVVMFCCVRRWKPENRFRRWAYGLVTVSILVLSPLPAAMLARQYGRMAMQLQIFPALAVSLGYQLGGPSFLPKRRRRKSAEPYQ